MDYITPAEVAAALVETGRRKLAQGFEHAVVNMFIIPTGVLLGAKVTMADWWVWNQIPVTLGNIVGGFVFTGLALYLTYRPRPMAPASPVIVGTQVPAE